MNDIPSIRRIRELLEGQETIEGAGVRLKRLFSKPEIPRLDPFLLLDDFTSSNPEDYLAGFPWHPHRGIETVTYVLNGEVEHGDSLGNKGVIDSGSVQWMTAGSGIIHQEMPQEVEGGLKGLQFWVNLPEKSKMMKPRYRDVKSSDVPNARLGSGVSARVIAGSVGGVEGPARHLVVDSEFVDFSLEPRAELSHETVKGHKVFAYCIAGKASFSPQSDLVSDKVVVFEDGGKVKVRAGKEGARFLLVSGKPLNEPIAWHGPIVMNSQEELIKAFKEFESGNFVKTGREQKEIDDLSGEDYYD